jgi:hypothetical protein
MEHAGAAAQENFVCARAVMGEGCAFNVPRRAAQERTQIFRMDFPHSMRPSNDAEFPDPEGSGRGVLGAAISAATYNFDTYSNKSERD